MRSARLFLALLVVGVAAVAAWGSPASAGAAADRNIVQTAVGAGQFKTLAALLEQAGLGGTLQGTGPFTVFAPTDAAFRKVPKSTLEALRADRQMLRRVLLYHVVKGNVKAAQVVKLRSARTVAGPRVRIAVRGSGVFLNGSTRVTKTDVAASNGTIHVIDRVLLPPAR